MPKNLLKLLRLLIPAIAVFSLTACGGSGSSSSGASSGSAFDSSLVVQVNDPSRFASNEAQLDTPLSITSSLSNLLISIAFAQTAEVQIYIGKDQIGETNSGGIAAIPISAGTYLVCIGSAGEEGDNHCIGVTVPPDSVVIVDGDNMTASAEPAQDHIVLFQDTQQSHKTIVCHKGQTISVGTPAAQAGHQVHGDSLGACPGDTAVARTDEEEEEEEDDESGSGKPEKSNTGKNNRPDKDTS